MYNQQLTKHFARSEFERSATAEKYGIDNSVPPSHIPSLTALCEHILEPLREHINGPVIISSGYRCPVLNKAVGGARNSQHITGEAADIVPPPTVIHSQPTALKSWFDWIEAHCNFDQLIWETANGRDYWIHVSCRRNLRQNRHQVIRHLRK